MYINKYVKRISLLNISVQHDYIKICLSEVSQTSPKYMKLNLKQVKCDITNKEVTIMYTTARKKSLVQ